MFSKADIQMHGEHFGEANPAVNVKAYAFGGNGRLEEDFGVTEEEAEKALEYAFEAHCEQFWEFYALDHVEFHLTPVFGFVPKFYSEGRSGGWLVVHGLPDVEEWDAIKVSAWGRFAKALEAERDYLCSYDAIKETIDSNGWLERDFERAGLVEVQ